MTAIRWKTVISSTTLQNDALAPLVGQAVEVTVTEATPSTPRDFREFLLSMPDVGDDADFARVDVPGRADATWDS